MTGTARSIRMRTAAALVTVAAALGCASGGGPQPVSTGDVQVTATSTVLDSLSGADTASADPAPREDALPALPLSQVEEPEARGRRITLEARGEDLRTVLRGLAESYGLDYRFHPDVRGRVNTRLRDATLEDALDAIVLGQGFDYAIQNGVLRVQPAELDTRIYTLDYIALSRVGVGTTIIQRRLGGGQLGQTGAGGLPGAAGGAGAAGAAGGLGGRGGADVISSVEVANLWDDIRVSLEGLLFDSPGEEQAQADAQPGIQGGNAPSAYSRVSPDGRRLIINPMAGTIMVAAPSSLLDQIEVFISAFEASITRQVLIEAKVVEVALDREFQFGIDWSALRDIGDVELRLNTSPPGGGGEGVELTLGTGEPGINTVLRALDTQGDVRVLSSPRVSTLSNQRAIINISTDEVFFAVTRQPILGPDGGVIGFNTEINPQQIAVGIVLDVFPQVAPDNSITMNIRPVVTDVIRVEEVRLEDGTQARAPVIDRRETDTVVRVRDGETIVIGGLMQTRQRTTESGVPVLKDIPLLGRLFSSTRREEEKRELVIFLTPKIVAGQAAAGS